MKSRTKKLFSFILAAIMIAATFATIPFTVFANEPKGLVAAKVEAAPTLDGKKDASYGETYSIEYNIQGASGDQSAQLAYAWDSEYIYVWATLYDKGNKNGSGRGIDHTNPAPHLYLYFDFGDGTRTSVTPGADGPSYYTVGISKACVTQNSVTTPAGACSETKNGIGAASDGKVYFIEDKSLVDTDANIANFQLFVEDDHARTNIEIAIPYSGDAEFALDDTLKVDAQYVQIIGNDNVRHDATLSGYDTEEKGQSDDFKTNPSTLGCTLTLGAAAVTEEPGEPGGENPDVPGDNEPDVPAVDDYVPTGDLSKDGGHDTANKIYYIRTAQQFHECLRWLDDKGDAEELVDQIILLNDIDMSGITDFKPAAGWKGGTFDGQGHVIKNLTSHANWTKSNSEYNSDHCGLFMDIKSNTTIKDVAFINMVFDANNTRDGGMLVGLLTNNETTVTFRNVVLTGKTEGKPENGKLGYFASAAGKKIASTNGKVIVENCVFVLTDPEQVDIFTLGWTKTNTKQGYGSAEIINSYALNVKDAVEQEEVSKTSDDKLRFEFLVDGAPVDLTLTKAYKIPATDLDTMKGGNEEKLGEEFTYADGKFPLPILYDKDEAAAIVAASGIDFAVTDRDGRPTAKMFTITWKVDGKTYTSQAEKNTIPSFADTGAEVDNFGRPVKAEDDTYKYVFKGWTPKVTEAVADVTYEGEFGKSAKPQPNTGNNATNNGGDNGSADANQPADGGDTSADTTTAQADTTPAEKKGCKGMLGSSAAFALVAVIGMGVALGKKK